MYSEIGDIWYLIKNDNQYVQGFLSEGVDIKLMFDRNQLM